MSTFGKPANPKNFLAHGPSFGICQDEVDRLRKALEEARR